MNVISEDLIEELHEVTTTRMRWWVVRFEDGYYGERIDEANDEGFDLKLFAKKEDADQAARTFLEGESFPYEIVEISLTEET